MLHIGIPSGITNLLVPISNMVITRIVAGFGHAAVAACGVAGRVEMFAFLIPMALGISQVPFIGQNWGAGRLDRVNLCRKYSNRFALYWGLCCAIVLMVTSGRIAALFSHDPKVIDVLTRYLWVVPLGYGMREIHRYVGFSFIGIGHPMSSAGINAVRILGLLLPATYFGARLFNLNGVFFGTLTADVLGAMIALMWAHTLFQAIHREALAGAPG